MKRFLLAIALALMSLNVYARCPNCPNGVCPVPSATDTPRSRYPAIVVCEYGSLVTGTIVDHNAATHTDIVLTCAHGWLNGHAASISLKGHRVKAEIISIDKALDVCVLQVPETGITPMPIADNAPAKGDAVWMAGFAHGGTFMLTDGHVTGYSTVFGNRENTYIVTTCLTEIGCSGGPIFNSKCEIVGTVSVKDAWRGPGHATGACTPMAFSRLACKKVYPATGFIPPPLTYVPCSVLPWRQEVEGKLESIDGKVSVPPAPGLSATPPAPIIIQQPAPTIQQAAGPDLRTLETLAQHGQAINDLHGKIDEIGKKVDSIPQTLAQRFQENLAKEKQDEPQSPKVKQDLDALKATIGNWLYAIIALIVAGIIALIVWNVLHGKGLYRKLIDATAANNPQNAKLQAYARQVDTNEDKWKDDLIAALPFLGKLPGVTQPATGVASVASPAPASTPATATPVSGDATHAAVTAALVTGAIQTALATPAPGQVPPASAPVPPAPQPAA